MFKNFYNVSFIILVTSQMVFADLILIKESVPLSGLALDHRRSSSCPSTDAGLCYSDNGDSICMAASERCCQLTSGTNPYNCPSNYPYCCPENTVTGDLMCGTTAACSGPINDGSNPKKSQGNLKAKEGAGGWSVILTLGVSVIGALM
jgi:hypothetical protein